MKPFKKDSPKRNSEAVLTEHKDIVTEAFGTVKTSINFDEWWYLAGWLMDHKKDLGRKYYILRDWCDGLHDIVEIEPPTPQKRYTCRYCGKQVLLCDVASTADNAITCRGCNYYAR